MIDWRNGENATTAAVLLGNKAQAAAAAYVNAKAAKASGVSIDAERANAERIKKYALEWGKRKARRTAAIVAAAVAGTAGIIKLLKKVIWLD